MNLAIDIGNSYFHLAVFKGNKVEFLCTGIAWDKILFTSGLKIISNQYRIQKIGYSSVVPRLDNYSIGAIKKYFGIKPLIINNKTNLPVKIKVDNPGTLGSDRICNAVFGYFNNITAKSNVLVIDLGTANKFDLVLSNGSYIGGIIAPGLITSSKALNINTGKLPELKFTDFTPEARLIGRSTAEAIQSGLVNYMKFAAEGIVAAIKKNYPGKLKIYLSGGSAKLIKDDLSFRYKYIENSVLAGINYILNYQ